MKRALFIIAFVLSSSPFSASTAHAQTVSDRWLPWVGCWQTRGEQERGDGTSGLCVVPAVGGVEMVSFKDGVLHTDETILTNGEEQKIDEAGCVGVQRAEWSRSGTMLYMSGDVTCDGQRQTISRVVALVNVVSGVVSGPAWIDVQVLSRIGANDIVGSRRYVPAVVPAGLLERLQPDLMARATADAAARPPLALQQVIETHAHMPSVGVEALLFESGGRFSLSRRDLSDLERARVSENVIDLMIALSYPEHFSVDREPRSLNPPVMAPSVFEADRHPLARFPGDLFYANSTGVTPYADCFSYTFGCYDYFPGSHLTYFPKGVPPSNEDGGGPARGSLSSAQHGSVQKDRGYSSDPASAGSRDRSDNASASSSAPREPTTTDSSNSSSSSDGRSTASAGGYVAGSSGGDSGRTAVPR